MADYIKELHLIPGYMHEGMKNWIEKGWLPGDFLTAILSNDLFGACARADSTNRGYIFKYAEYLYNYAPSGCFGSPAKVSAWCDAGGLEGMAAKNG